MRFGAEGPKSLFESGAFNRALPPLRLLFIAMDWMSQAKASWRKLLSEEIQGRRECPKACTSLPAKAGGGNGETRKRDGSGFTSPYTVRLLQKTRRTPSCATLSLPLRYPAKGSSCFLSLNNQPLICLAQAWPGEPGHEPAS
jgi:hypothetical protein